MPSQLDIQQSDDLAFHSKAINEWMHFHLLAVVTQDAQLTLLPSQLLRWILKPPLREYRPHLDPLDLSRLRAGKGREVRSLK